MICVCRTNYLDVAGFSLITLQRWGWPRGDHPKCFTDMSRSSKPLPQVALHPFPGDLHLLTTAAPEGWEPRALFGSQRFKAGSCAAVEHSMAVPWKHW